MKFGFQIRSDVHKWGGDLGILYALAGALKILGHEAFFSSSPLELLHTDFLFLTNSCFDLRAHSEILEAVDKPFGIIPFHEDHLLYQPFASGLYRMIADHLGMQILGPSFACSSSHYPPTFEHLLSHPQIASYYGDPPKPFALYNRNVFEACFFSIASSQREASVILRDSPYAKTVVIPWGLPNKVELPQDTPFLRWTGLSSGNYLLQIGRLQARKNQLASIIATRNIDLPLVLIALESFEKNYERACIEAALRYRKALTLIISQTLPERKEGGLHILPMPGKQKLPASLIRDALQHTGLYLHPAFQELPGLVFLEAASCGVPMIASSWCTIEEYFHGKEFNSRILYPLPHDLSAIERGVRELFGRRFLPPIDHPALSRSLFDVASDFLKALTHT